MQNGGKNSNINRHLKHWIPNFKTSLKNLRIENKNIVYLEENKLMISFYSKYISIFNELRILKPALCGHASYFTVKGKKFI